MRMKAAAARSLAKVARLCNGVSRDFRWSACAAGYQAVTRRNSAGGQTNPMEEARAEFPLAPASDD
jgi:hypothetical protein